MTRFARDCLSTVNDVTRSLERTLGPDTGDLRFRFGLNSGQVTAGVIAGQNFRFQLFGDTVNTGKSCGASERFGIRRNYATVLVGLANSMH